MTPAPIDVAGAMHGWQVALPAITALCAAFVVMLTDLAMRGTERDGVAVVGVLGLGATMAVAIGLWVAPAVSGVIMIRPRAAGVRQEPPLPVKVEAGPVGETDGLAERIRSRLRDKLMLATEIELVPVGSLPV